MIVVRVELHSAITGKTTELARMIIANDGAGTAKHGNYKGVTLCGRNTEALDRRVVNKSATVTGYPRQALHVWNLVRRMLVGMGYTK